MKKVLSWVLVLALVLSSFTMAFAADKTANSSDMKDAAAIANVEAVDVMVATGIIGGYPDGYYYPEKAVTRAEMAKMISVAVNGGEDVGAYYADSCTFADSVSHWAAGYIAYCANEGIIDGRDANTFDPDATVTGSEAAKMVLVALGYDSKIEKYVGGQWEANVLKAAKANGLFDGCDDFTAGAALDRDNAAQIIFNGLQAPTVDYAFDWEISAGDTTITVETAANKVVDDTPNTGDFAQLFEVAFTDPVLAYEDGGNYAADDFERPAHGWSLDNEEIGVYADSADYTFVVTAAGQLNTVAIEEWDEDFLDENTLGTVKYNGANGSATGSVALGDVVELYETTTDGEYNVVILHYDVVQIAVDTDVTDALAEDGVSAYVDFGSISTNDTKVPGFDAATYVDEAYIAVAYKSGNTATTNIDNVLDTYVPEVVTGEVTKTTSTKVYVDGTPYEYTTGLVQGDVAVENTYDFYLINGYAAEAVVVDEVTELYGIYLGYKEDGGYSDDSDVYTVKLYTPEGEKIYTVDADYALGAGYKSATPGATPANANALVKYTVNEDGELDSIEAASAWSKSGKMSNGYYNGASVEEDVVAFCYDTIAEEWIVYDYADLEASDGIETDTAFVDSKLYAVKLDNNATLTSADTVLALVTDVTQVKTNNAGTKGYYEVSALVDGVETEYATAVGTFGTSGTEAWSKEASRPVDKFYVLTLNADNEVSVVTLAKKDVSATLNDAFATGQDVNVNSNTAVPVYGKDGSVLDTNSDANVFDPMAINVLYVFDDGEWTVEKLNTLTFPSNITFVQTEEDASVWNIAIKGKNATDLFGNLV